MTTDANLVAGLGKPGAPGAPGAQVRIFCAERIVLAKRDIPCSMLVDVHASHAFSTPSNENAGSSHDGGNQNCFDFVVLQGAAGFPGPLGPAGPPGAAGELLN